jgi:hypothetical protein
MQKANIGRRQAMITVLFRRMKELGDREEGRSGRCRRIVILIFSISFPEGLIKYLLIATETHPLRLAK